MPLFLLLLFLNRRRWHGVIFQPPCTTYKCRDWWRRRVSEYLIYLHILTIRVNPNDGLSLWYLLSPDTDCYGNINHGYWYFIASFSQNGPLFWIKMQQWKLNWSGWWKLWIHSTVMHHVMIWRSWDCRNEVMLHNMHTYMMCLAIGKELSAKLLSVFQEAHFHLIMLLVLGSDKTV